MHLSSHWLDYGGQGGSAATVLWQDPVLGLRGRRVPVLAWIGLHSDSRQMMAA